MSEMYLTFEERSQDHLQICEGFNAANSFTSKSIDNGNFEKHCAVWSTTATSILLKLYENKLDMIESPKKKTRIWTAISESLKDYNIEVTPNQIRWKINALTKKYKQCLNNGQQDRFKYFKVMDNIYSQYCIDSGSNNIVELVKNRKYSHRPIISKQDRQETNAMIEMRKMRLANRIDSDRSQVKIELERQWLDYLQRQEQKKQRQEKIYERNLKLREEELYLRKTQLELKETLEYKEIQLMEKEVEIMLEMELEKYDLLTKYLISL